MIQGSTFTIGALFGGCEVLGVLIGDRFIDYVPDHIAQISIFAINLIVTSVLKLV